MNQNERPLSISQIVDLMLKHGDDRNAEALRVHVTRAIETGSLQGAFKANPDGQTSPWLVPAAEVRDWMGLTHAVV